MFKHYVNASYGTGLFVILKKFLPLVNLKTLDV